MKLLHKRSTHPNIVAVIKGLNTGNHTYIKTENNLTKKTPVTTGTSPFDSLNPVLFNIMDEIISGRTISGQRIQNWQP